MSDRVWSGSCLCGELQFDAVGEPTDSCYCHCESCRAAAGAPFVAWCTFPIDAFSITSGQLTTYKSSAKAERGFCGLCGTTVSYYNEDRPGEIDIATITLRDADCVPPLRHLWVSERCPWLEINDDLPKFERWGGG